MNEFVSADHPVVVLVHLLENLLYTFFGMRGVVQEEGYFIVGDASWMVDIEVRKGLLEVLFAKEILELEAGDDKLSQIDVSRAICVDHTHQKTHSSLRNAWLGPEGRLKL